ncbi:amidohydrolase family protein [Streptomyces sp. NPDC001890]|uniref:amidohydrolase family protein n=1 Tax=Streptomyces sp. NPDC001890 TaxID=3364620 RepID=UPI0036CAB979
MTPPPSTDRILLAALLLPGPRGEAVRDAAVVVRDGLVADAGPREEVLARADDRAPVLDFATRTLLPGLVDSHVHLVFDASPEPVAALRAADDHSVLLAAAGRARALLDAGVTTVRDLGDRSFLTLALRDAVADGTLAGPRILTAGPPLTITGGHCWFLGGEADGEDGVRRAARARLRAGTDWIKVMATGGTFTPGGPPPWRSQYGLPELTAAADEAHRFGRRAAAHVHGTAGIEDAVAAGFDTLEHCSFSTGAGVATDRDAARRLADRLAERDIAVCPTLSGGLRDKLPDLGEELVWRVLDQVGLLHRHGVRVIAGTDAGMPGSDFGRFAEGLEWFAEAGLSTAEVLESATVGAAHALGLADRTGRIAPGLDADLLVVDDDPRTSLHTLRRPHAVFARGRLHVPHDSAEGSLR